MKHMIGRLPLVKTRAAFTASVNTHRAQHTLELKAASLQPTRADASKSISISLTRVMLCRWKLCISALSRCAWRHNTFILFFRERERQAWGVHACGTLLFSLPRRKQRDSFKAWAAFFRAYRQAEDQALNQGRELKRASRRLFANKALFSTHLAIFLVETSTSNMHLN